MMMKRQTPSTSFREELQKTFLTYALVPIALAVVVVLCILGYMLVKDVILGSRSDVSAVSQRIEEELTAYEDEIKRVMRDMDIERFLYDGNGRAQALHDIYSFLNSRDNRMAFYLLDAEGSPLFTTERSAQRQRECVEGINVGMIHGIRRDGVQNANLIMRCVTQEGGGAYWLVGGVLTDEGDRAAGYACFVLSESSFSSLVADIGSMVIVTNSFGYVFTSGHPAYRVEFGKLDRTVRGQSGILRYGDTLYYQSVVDMGDYVIYAVRECGNVIMTALMLMGFAVMAFLIIALSVAASANRIAASKTKIIEEITSACRQAQAGNLMTRLQISSHDEFKVIGDAYNSMLDSIRELMEHSVELAEETAVARIKQLESQFHPHFLFNTLENVRFMIRLDPKVADEMMVDLSMLLRYSISTSEQVTLEEDMDYTRRYMRLLKMRFEDRLHVTIDLPDELRGAKMMRLITQPIIENAVKYCIDQMDVLRVDVRAERDGSDLLLIVRDNGQGIEEEILATLQERMAQPKAGAWGHIGILNVHERIRLMYGEEYGLSIASSREGTTATLRFPCQMEEG